MRYVERLASRIVERRMSGRALPVDQVVDRDPKSGRQLRKRLRRDMPTLASFDERGVSEREVGPLIETAGGETEALARGPETVGDVHEDSCTLKYSCSQSDLLNTSVAGDRASRDNADVPSRNPITLRIEQLRKARGMTQRALSLAAGLGASTITKLEERGSAPSLDNAMAIAKVFGMSLDELVGAYPESVETSFSDLMKWAHETPAIAKVLTLHGKGVTVGDLLRYRAAPSSRGQHDADEVWTMMQAMRKGRIDPSPGTDVTPTDEAKVLKITKRKPKR
jgi:transcriptional regulator with XRE-family HTH domain